MLPLIFYKLSDLRNFLPCFIGWKKQLTTKEPLLLGNTICRVSLRWHFTSNILTIIPFPIDIFANLAGYVKLYLDSKSDDNRQMTKETILDFWDRMAEAKNYSQVDQRDFKKRTHRLLSKKKSQKSQTSIDECTFFSSEPPSKVAAPTSSSPWCYFLLPFAFHMLIGPHVYIIAQRSWWLLLIPIHLKNNDYSVSAMGCSRCHFEDLIFNVGWWRSCYWWRADVVGKPAKMLLIPIQTLPIIMNDM